MSNRDIKDLSAIMRLKCLLWCDRMSKEGIDYIITCPRRTLDEQKILYSQGKNGFG
jgi:hypothetical protein